MRTYEEYHRILTLWEAGENKLGIERITGIPRATVRDCINRYGSIAGLEANRDRASRSKPDEVLKRIKNTQDIAIQKAYAYLLGIYLGDGYIVRNERVYFLRIFLGSVYPDIIQFCAKAINVILPENKVNVLKQKHANCVEVICSHKFWPEILPQSGTGRKHNRVIILEEWQQQIVDTYPLEFFRGLYHSDGSRFSNVVKGKDYPRYQFTNHSDDIRKLFCDTCDKLGIHWTVKYRKSLGESATDIFISKHKDVEYLDQVVGPKS